MSLHYYQEEEYNEKQDSINNYQNLFIKYLYEPQNLSDSLKQMFIGCGLSEEKSNALIEEITQKAKDTVNKNIKKIKKYYPKIDYNDALIISSYTCESIDKKYSPYIILNQNIISKNKKETLKIISKYLFILLNSLRKLKKFYPKKNKYLYRCINSKLNLNRQNYNNEKIFWGFISTTSEVKLSYNYLGKEIKNNTIFSLSGDVWGYDITLFNYYNEEEILLEPEVKYLITGIGKDNNDIIMINCKFENVGLVDFQDVIQIYYENENRSNCFTIFGEQFVKNNKYNNNLKIIYENNEFELQSTFEGINDRQLEIKLKGFSLITDMSYMFHKTSMKSLNLIPQWDAQNVTNMKHMFSDSLLNLSPDISKWNTSKVIDMSYMFYNCSSLKNFPDISNWDISNVNNISNMFSNCSLLTSLPNISKWNTSNIKDMNHLFHNLKKINSFPDISYWNCINVTNISHMFSECSEIESIPDISKWETSKISDISYLFYNCKLLSSLPDISKWKTSNVINTGFLFNHCESLSSLPDISKWNTSNVNDMKEMFCNCVSLTSLPNISKWDTSNVKNKKDMFKGCKTKLKIPSKFKN